MPSSHHVKDCYDVVSIYTATVISFVSYSLILSYSSFLGSDAVFVAETSQQLDKSALSRFSRPRPPATSCPVIVSLLKYLPIN
jgi:hypothetical protein